MIVDFDTDELKPCQCGFTPKSYSMGYGRTPYCIRCPECNKQTNFGKCLVTGRVANLIDYWNTHIRHLTKEQVDVEVSEFRIEKNKETGYDGWTNYDYYWEVDNGEVLYKSC